MTKDTNEKSYFAVSCSEAEWAQICHRSALVLLSAWELAMQADPDCLNRVVFERTLRGAMETAVRSMAGEAEAIRLVEAAALRQQAREAQQTGKVN